MEILLEQVDKVIERTGVTYKEAKEALEATEGDVLEAVIYIETNNQKKEQSKNEKNQTIEEFKEWIKETINKGNVTRIKIKKEDKELLDIPANAGIAGAALAALMPSLLAIGVLTVVSCKLTVEITFEDGNVSVVNTVVSETAKNVKDKASEIGGKIKSKFDQKVGKNRKNSSSSDEPSYVYKVNFDDEDDYEDEDEIKEDKE